MDKSVSPRPPLRKRIIPSILRRLGSVGIRIELFLVVREGIDQSWSVPVDPKYAFRFLTPADIDKLRRLKLGEEIRDKLNAWFHEGKLCFGAMDGDRLIGMMWCDLETLNHPPAFRHLSPSEAYLFAAHVDPDYRGKSVAPQMRTALYAALRKIGRTEFVSYTEYWNSSARRFKSKLGARDESLRLSIDLFGMLRRTFMLRKFL